MSSTYDSYGYQNNLLCLLSSNGPVPIEKLIPQPYETPVYVYNMDDIVRRTEFLKESFAGRLKIHYAMKANDRLPILKLFREMGCGVDIVSGGELSKALQAGIGPKDIVFSGVAKTRSEILGALQVGVGQINVESPAELRRIGEMAQKLGLKAAVAFRLNPDVNPKTHPYIKTGFRENKFGMDLSFFEELKTILAKFSSSLELVGVTMHIGSQLRELSATFEAIDKSLSIWDALKDQGYPMRTFDIGGGIGIDYQSLDSTSEFELLKEYGAGVLDRIGNRDLEIHGEPGRILVGRSGVLVSEVQYIKKTPYKNFVILDAGMHQLLRPSLYQAFHQILPMKATSSTGQDVYDVVGPICESADVLGSHRVLSQPQSGDFLCIMDTGAYGAVMSSDYNSRPEFQEIFVSAGQVVHANS